MENYFASATDKAIAAGQSILKEEKRGMRAYAVYLGPAIIASIAYMDPGNFATNIQSGAQFGYELLWVVLLANLIAMLFQALSAKLGIVTGKSLAEHCREHFSKPVVYTMWGASEIAAMATDLAEVVGGAIGLSLLLQIPLLIGVAVVGIATYLVMQLQQYGFRPMEAVIGTFVAVISFSYLAEVFLIPPNWKAVLLHSLVPHLSGNASILLAVGIVGATVMPHAIYLHSSLTKNRMPAPTDAQKRRVLRFSNREVLAALGVAGLVNMAMLAMSAAAFYFTGHGNVADITTAYHTLMPLLGIGAAGIFMVSLLASGFSSSIVGTMAGQTIMQDFVGFKIPLWVRRAATLIPAFIVVALGINATQALVVSQVILSLVLPIPMIALLLFTARRGVMGAFANSRLINIVASVAGVIILALNIVLLLQITNIPLVNISLAWISQ